MGVFGSFASAPGGAARRRGQGTSAAARLVKLRLFIAIYELAVKGRNDDTIGYEASFLVFDGNPLEDFRQVQTIPLRFKQGQPLRLDLPASGAAEKAPAREGRP